MSQHVLVKQFTSHHYADYIFYFNKDKMSEFGKDSDLAVGHTEHLLLISIDFTKCCN